VAAPISSSATDSQLRCSIPVMPAMAMAAMSTPRSRLAAIIGGRGGCRSIHSPIGRVRKRNGKNSMVRSRLSCPALAPRAVIASTGMANVVI
jgi:hypothetical protein